MSDFKDIIEAHENNAKPAWDSAKNWDTIAQKTSKKKDKKVSPIWLILLGSLLSFILGYGLKSYPANQEEVKKEVIEAASLIPSVIRDSIVIIRDTIKVDAPQKTIIKVVKDTTVYFAAELTKSKAVDQDLTELSQDLNSKVPSIASTIISLPTKQDNFDTVLTTKETLAVKSTKLRTTKKYATNVYFDRVSVPTITEFHWMLSLKSSNTRNTIDVVVK